MKSKYDLELQLIALGMEPTAGESLDVLYDLYKETEIDQKNLIQLFEKLKLRKIRLEWDDSEYKPEESIKKRCLQLSETFVNDMNGNYPTKVNQDCGESFHHLVVHGKCGLMALLFSLEKVGGLKCSDIAAMIETFMTHIDAEFDQLIQHQNMQQISKALRLSCDPSSDFKDFIKGRLQLFSLMRSAYLEEKTKNLSPLQWWVQHERYIPALPV